MVASLHYSHCCYYSSPRTAFACATEGMSQSQGWTCAAPFPWCVFTTLHTLCMLSSTCTDSNHLLALSSFRLGKCCCFYSSCQSLASWQNYPVSTFDSQLPPWKHQLRCREDGPCQARMSHPWEVTRGTRLVLNNGHNWVLYSKAHGCENKVYANWSEWPLALQKLSHLAILKSFQFSLH